MPNFYDVATVFVHPDEKYGRELVEEVFEEYGEDTDRYYLLPSSVSADISNREKTAFERAEAFDRKDGLAVDSIAGEIDPVNALNLVARYDTIRLVGGYLDECVVNAFEALYKGHEETSSDSLAVELVAEGTVYQSYSEKTVTLEEMLDLKGSGMADRLLELVDLYVDPMTLERDDEEVEEAHKQYHDRLATAEAKERKRLLEQYAVLEGRPEEGFEFKIV